MGDASPVTVCCADARGDDRPPTPVTGEGLRDMLDNPDDFV